MVGRRKVDPPASKKKPVAVDTPEFLAKMGLEDGLLGIVKAVGGFYADYFLNYLLRIGEYTMKMTRNETKHTIQFWLESVTLFEKDCRGALRQLPINASDADILYADGETLRLDNQKNGREILCVYQDHNYDGYYSPVQVFCCRYVHNCSLSADQTRPLSVYLENYQHNDV